MSQQTLEILSDEQIAPSLLESTYPELIASVGYIDSEDLLAVEYSLDSEYSLGLENFGDSAYSLDAEIFGDSAYSLDAENFLEAENSSFVQGIEVDSLTGVPTDSTVYTRGPRRTTALRDPGLAIQKFSYNNLAEVTATVRVELSPLVRFFIEEDLVDITLQASVWGIDSRRNSHLFNFSDQLITGEGTYTFKTLVNSNVLDEDTGFFQDGPTDEIATKFSLISSDPAVVGVNLTAWSNIVKGRY
jgi:hypothetical protein